jgi:F-type H+-transporting ATPase subunit c
MKLLKTAAMVMALLVMSAASALAQGTEGTVPTGPVVSTPDAPVKLGAIGVGMTIIGAAIGIGWLTRSAVESMARQPELATNIQGAMIISAALIEGATFFALILIGFILAS